MLWTRALKHAAQCSPDAPSSSKTRGPPKSSASFRQNIPSATPFSMSSRHRLHGPQGNSARPNMPPTAKGPCPASDSPKGPQPRLRRRTTHLPRPVVTATSQLEAATQAPTPEGAQAYQERSEQADHSQRPQTDTRPLEPHCSQPAPLVARRDLVPGPSGHSQADLPRPDAAATGTQGLSLDTRMHTCTPTSLRHFTGSKMR
jgi:hypothetical protein